MKKMLALLMAATMTLSLAACGGSSTSGSASSGSTASPSTEDSASTSSTGLR